MKKLIKDKSQLNAKTVKAWQKLFLSVTDKMCEGIAAETNAQD